MDHGKERAKTLRREQQANLIGIGKDGEHALHCQQREDSLLKNMTRNMYGNWSKNDHALTSASFHQAQICTPAETSSRLPATSDLHRLSGAR